MLTINNGPTQTFYLVSIVKSLKHKKVEIFIFVRNGNKSNSKMYCDDLDDDIYGTS